MLCGCFFKEEISELLKIDSAIGIDLSVTDFAIFSDGQKIDNNKFTSKMDLSCLLYPT